MTKLRLAFMGTPDFSIKTLRALKEAGHDIVAVYTQTPKPAGRGQILQKSPVHRAAEEMNITVRTPKTLRVPDEQEFFASLKLDLAVVVAYGLILPHTVLAAPRLGCINIHFSLLPRWRGAMPVQHALLAGDMETGIDIMQMATGLDTGDILLREKVAITPKSTTSSLLEDLATRGAKLTLKAADGLAKGTIKPVPQESEGTTYASKLKREDGHINWGKAADVLDRQIRALTPWPGSFFLLNGEPIKVLEAEVINSEGEKPGLLLDEHFTIACSKNALRLKTVQRSGKGPTDGAAFLRGARLTIGLVL